MRISLWGTFAMDAFEKPLKKLQDTVRIVFKMFIHLKVI